MSRLSDLVLFRSRRDRRADELSDEAMVQMLRAAADELAELRALIQRIAIIARHPKRMCGWPPRCKGEDDWLWRVVGGVHVSGLSEAATRTAGLDEIRGSGPDQTDALEAPRAFLGVPISSIDRRVITSISADAPRPPAASMRPALVSSRPVGLAARQHRPDDSRHLVGERHRGELQRLPGHELADPTLGEVLPLTTPPDDRKCAGHKQAADRTVPHLGDPAQPLVAAARAL